MIPIAHIAAEAAQVRALLASPLMAHAPVPTTEGFGPRPADQMARIAEDDAFDFAF